jgi:hypothetical protein
MPIERKKMIYTIDEIFGMMPVSSKEVETPRTNDLGNIREPNWDSKLKQFSLGLQNSKESILSNMIIDKMPSNTFGINDFLNYLETSQMRFFDFLMSVIEKMTAAVSNLKKD